MMHPEELSMLLWKAGLWFIDGEQKLEGFSAQSSSGRAVWRLWAHDGSWSLVLDLWNANGFRFDEQTGDPSDALMWLRLKYT